MFDLHTHTVFSDGKNTPEEMVCSAIGKGLSAIGISDHSYTEFDTSYCVPKEKLPLYRETVLSLKEKYKGKIDVRLGIEQDLYATGPTAGYDYVIGSAHYIRAGGKYVPVDESRQDFEKIRDTVFGGDALALCEAYFDALCDLVPKTGCDIVGHFDLVSKFNRDGSLFDETCDRYLAAARRAIDAIVPYGKPFEINTGAMSRGYRDIPYPAPALCEMIRERGGRFVLSSDAHDAGGIAFAFERYESFGGVR